MTRSKEKPVLRAWSVRDPENGALIRDTSGKVVRIESWTRKAARHQAKTMFGGKVEVEVMT